MPNLFQVFRLAAKRFSPRTSSAQLSSKVQEGTSSQWSQSSAFTTSNAGCLRLQQGREAAEGPLPIRIGARSSKGLVAIGALLEDLEVTLGCYVNW